MWRRHLYDVDLRPLTMPVEKAADSGGLRGSFEQQARKSQALLTEEHAAILSGELFRNSPFERAVACRIFSGHELVCVDIWTFQVQSPAGAADNDACPWDLADWIGVLVLVVLSVCIGIAAWAVYEECRMGRC